jgi:putative ABC transport system permease protein
MTILAISIACLGLFGVSTIIIQLRFKEIGIRKVNGATSGNIIYMLSKEFIQWVFIALIIATPVTWYLLIKWSENYPYKVPISWWIFPLSGLIALIFAWISMSYYTFKAAHQNPVEVLRYE